jgi:hypothetical protein
MRRQIAPLFAFIVIGCGDPIVEPASPDDTAKLTLAAAIADACPLAAPNDAAARNQCADALSDSALLRDATSETILWGGQPADKTLDKVIDEASLTAFNPRVWRRMYLSTFMFTGEAYVTQEGKYRVLHMPVQFRNLLDPGEYPYPFWHSEKKWRAYEVSLEVLFYYDGDTLVGSTRSAMKDESRSHFARMWDGNWTWEGGAQPRVTLYSNLFSATNPNVERLESAYRALEDGMRTQNCTTCHDPTNAAMAKQLELLNYPNQALGSRHDVVAQLEHNAMPPGIGVSDQLVRIDLIRLANEFAVAGDEALKFEGETVLRPQLQE